MSPELTVAIIAAIVGPTLGLIGVIIMARNSRKTAEKTNQAAVDNAKAAAKNAASTEFSILTQGFTATFERQDRELAELRDQAEEDEAFKEEVLTFVSELVQHIDTLEDLVPNPPGAPPRPKFPETMRVRLRRRA